MFKDSVDICAAPSRDPWQLVLGHCFGDEVLRSPDCLSCLSLSSFPVDEFGVCRCVLLSLGSATVFSLFPPQLLLRGCFVPCVACRGCPCVGGLANPCLTVVLRGHLRRALKFEGTVRVEHLVGQTFKLRAVGEGTKHRSPPPPLPGRSD